MKKFLKYNKKFCLQINVGKCRGILFFVIQQGEDYVSEKQKSEERNRTKKKKSRANLNTKEKQHYTILSLAGLIGLSRKHSILSRITSHIMMTL